MRKRQKIAKALDNKTTDTTFSKITKKIITVLIVLLPPALFLSYHPVISLGADSAMNFEFSIAEIWLVVFFLASLPFVKKVATFYGWKKLALAAAIPLYFTISTIWSTNRIRTLLTVGLFWLIVFAALNLIYWLKKDECIKKTDATKTVNSACYSKPNVKNHCLRCMLGKSLIITAVVASIFCWLQCFLDLAGVSREYTLLCQGCVSTKFGFPHPNGFAIEPQFMGNLLLAPVLLCFYLVINPSASKLIKTRAHKIILIALTVFLSSTLFLTLSRGAIYAFIIALIAEIILTILSRRCLVTEIAKKPATATNLAEKTQKLSIKSAIFKPIIIATFAFAISLCVQGTFAALGPTNDTFYSGVTKAIHQLSLGKIDLRPAGLTDQTGTAPTESSDEPNSSQEKYDVEQFKNITIHALDQPSATGEMSSGQINETIDNQTSQFSGYVAESTDVRLSLNQIAVDTWRSRPQYILVGTGLGGAGVAMHQAFPDEIGSKEIVQNEYVSLLLETGIVGYLIILAVVVAAFWIMRTSKKSTAKNSSKSELAKSTKISQPLSSPLFPLFASVVLAFLLTLLFFSGLPNAIHIYLFPLIFI